MSTPRPVAAFTSGTAVPGASAAMPCALLSLALHLAFLASWGYVCWLMHQTL